MKFKLQPFGKLAFLCVWFVFNKSSAQTVPAPPLTTIIGPSPDVSSLQKYGDIPVSPYTGVPDISIPLYSIKFHDITVPISVSYHASGVKVSEEASQVGLGWALSAGGAISRKIVGSDDFLPNVYFNITPSTQDLTSYYQPTPNISSGTQLNTVSGNVLDFTQQLNSGNPEVDFRPDEFYYNLLGKSGKFLMERTMTAVLEHQEKMDIYCLPNSSGVYDGSVWQVKTVDGYIYDFQQAEYYKDPNGNLTPHYSAVYLTQITSPTGNKVKFTYVSNGGLNNYVQPTGSFTQIEDDGEPQLPEGGQYTYNPPPMGKFRTEATGQLYTSFSLSTIDYDDGQVQFSYTNNRVDVPGSNQLNTISVFSKDVHGNLSTSPLKTFTFGYSYFYGPTAGPAGSNFAGANQNGANLDMYTKRLQLNSITESGTYNGQTLTQNPYLFSYYTIGNNLMPSKDSFACDHWGYFNGNISNTSFIPQFTQIASPATQAGWFGIPDNSRDSNGLFMAAFSLSDITYPTGGTTHIDYEANDCDEQNSLVNDQSGNPYPYTILPGKQSPYNLAWYINTPQLPNLDMSDEYVGPDGSVPVTINLAIRLNGGQPGNFSANSIIKGDFYLNMVNVATGASFPFDPAVYSGSTTIQQGTVIAMNLTTNIPPGIYQMQYVVNTNTNDPSNYGQWVNDTNGQLTYKTQVTSNPQPGVTNPTTYSQCGGLRVLRLTNNDGINPPQIKKYIYHYNSGNYTFSYGRTMTRPQYSYWEQSEDIWEIETTTRNIYYSIWPEHLMRTSASNIPLNGSATGSAVGYDQVTVLYGENGENGRTIYKYHNNPDLVLPYSFQGMASQPLIRRRPYGSTIPDPLNGSLLEQTDYANINGQMTNVKDVINNYSANAVYENDIYGFEDHIQPHFTTITNFTGGIYYNGPANSTVSGPSYTPAQSTDRLLYTYSAIQSTWTFLTSTDEKSYSSVDPTKYSERIVNYYYDNPKHYLPTRTVETNSQGEVITTTTSYPQDFLNLTNQDAIAPGVNNLIANHILDAPVEKIVQKPDLQNSSYTLTVGGTLTGYYGTGVPLPSTIYQLQTPIPLTNFVSYALSGSKATSYQPVLTLDQYDQSNGNIQQQHKNQDINNSYLWGYNKDYPIAQCKNAASNEFFYEGFEENTSSGVTNTPLTAHTGHYYYSGSSYVVSWTKPNSRVYKISFWYYTSANGWAYSGEQTYSSNSYTLTGGSAYDDIRIYPADAQLTTYTYDKLVGMTSMTDQKGETTYYEYDGLQRLMNIKDMNGNITKHFDYHYTGQ